MGGKPKQTQRTKNNSRPSNSGRSAELFGTSMPAFVGFTSLAMCGSDTPVLPGFQHTTSPDGLLDDIDIANVDTNYQLVLRKMTKKDPVTKVKALQEFLELCNASEVDAVVAILPFWPRLYAALSADVEHRVREASQQAQAGVAAKCGKHIAPYLRQLAPAWITSQFDTYAPAASLATQSFQKSFKPAKQQEVFTYCQAELLDYVTKNVTVVTAASMSTAHRTYTPEECEAKYQRLVTGCLKGYSQYLTRVSAEQLAEAADRNLAIVNHAKFWSYYKSKASSIRAAWFETLASILQHAPHFVQGHEKEATISTMQTLDETEPIVLPHVWSAVLLVTQTVPEWIQYVNIEKALLPKIWKVLKSGGAGSAAVIHPHLLPLLSQLNVAALGQDKILTFYTDFFEHMHTGLLSRVGHQSRSDTTAIATAYFECLRYTLIQVLKFGESVLSTDELNTFGRRLVDDHLIAVIVWTLSVDVSGTKHVYAAIANLLGYWTQNSEAQPLYTVVLAHFWTALRIVLGESFNADEERTAKILRLQFELVQELRAGHQHTSKASRAKVKFIEATAVDAVDGSSTADGGSSAAPMVAPRRIECNELALHLCTLYMKKATEKLSSHFVDSVENLFKAFGGAEFYERLADGNGIFKLYDKISVWLLIAQLRQENVVDILLQLYAHLSADSGERHKLLTKLLKFPNEQVQSWLIVRLLSHPLCAEPAVPALLAEPNVRQILFECADRIVAGDTSANVNFLHKCFFQNEAGDILIDATTCAGIVERLVAALRTADADDCGVLDTCASFLAQIMPVICCDAAQRELQQKLFVAFFEFSVRQTVSEHLTQDTLWEITTSWQDALSSGDMVLSDELLGQCAAIVERKLAEEDCDAETSVENTAEMVAKLILCSVERLQADGGGDDNSDDSSESAVMRRTDEILDRMFDSRSNVHRSRLSYVEHVSLFAGAVGGELSVPDIGSRLGTTDDVRSVHTIDAFMKLAAFRFNVIFKITCTVKQQRPSAAGRKPSDTPAAADDNGDDDDADEYTEDFCDASENLLKRFSDRIVDEIIGGIYVASMADTLLPRCYAWAPITELCMLQISERVALYLRNVAAAYAPVIRNRLLAEAKRRGQLWSASVLWLTNVAPYDDPDNGLTMLREEDELAAEAHVSKDVYVNLLQTIAAKTPPRLLPIERNLFVDDVDANLFVKCTTLRTLVENYTHGEWNDQDDRLIMEACAALMNSLYLECKRDKPYFLYNEDISNTPSVHIIHIAEIANFYAAVLRAFPYRLESNDWDLIRIAVSSWTLSVSRSSDTVLQSPAVAVFVVAVYRLFGAFRAFIGPTQRSSTHLLTTVTDEWNQLFAKDVNLILLKCYLKFVSRQHRDRLTDLLFVDLLSQQVAHIDYSHVIAARRIDSKTSLDDVIEFALTHLSHDNHRVRCACASLLRGLADGLIAIDAERLLLRQSSDDDHVDVSPAAAASRASNTWHVLHRFASALQRHEAAMLEYSDEFSFKSNELDNLRDVPPAIALPYLLLWNCVLDVCSRAGAELRAIYAAYLTASEAPHVQRMLVALFRLMPVELLRNQDARHIGQTYFAPLTDGQLAAADVPTRRLACNTYLRALRHLPAAVRKWWHDAPAAQKTLVDKVTTSFVSGQLCQDELRALVDKRGVTAGSENMQLTVHTSTREVIATYVIDEARMELIVTLPVNHPLGAVRVDSGKQIGGRMQSRVLVMQLTIFLTHQNGSLSDGLSLWKRNLDRKFEGVQECYVCYAVIHQDTYQLPKLSCRKCKNKFHGPCLYKWFSTSNKSTCPICRSIF